MTSLFSFGPNHIDDHMEKVGVDVRPVIECKMERTKLFEFGNRLVDQYPGLFESLVQSPNDFQIRKKFIFPGKGETDMTTLAVTVRGPLFIFPRKVSVFDEETNVEPSEEIVKHGLRLFREIFPLKKIVRVGHVNEYIFSTDVTESTQLVAERFTKIKVGVGGELSLRVNRPVDDYNRIVQLEPVAKLKTSMHSPYEGEVKGYGVKVNVDFNNRDMTQELDESRILHILHDSWQFNKDQLYAFLNGTSEAE